MSCLIRAKGAAAAHDIRVPLLPPSLSLSASYDPSHSSPVFLSSNSLASIAQYPWEANVFGNNLQIKEFRELGPMTFADGLPIGLVRSGGSSPLHDLPGSASPPSPCLFSPPLSFCAVLLSPPPPLLPSACQSFAPPNWMNAPFPAGWRPLIVFTIWSRNQAKERERGAFVA